MRYLNLAFALLLLFAVQPYNAQSVSAQNYTKGQAGLIFSNASAYVNMINQSSYLVFSPNLKQAESDLDRARSLLNTSPVDSVLYSKIAVESANSAYERISTYRGISELGALAFTVIMVLLLYRFMKPVKARR